VSETHPQIHLLKVEMVELLLLLTHQVEEFVTALVAAEAADLLAEMDL
jgi:hypothetical protein